MCIFGREKKNQSRIVQLIFIQEATGKPETVIRREGGGGRDEAVGENRHSAEGGWIYCDSDRQQTGCPKLRWSFTLRLQTPLSLTTCLSENNSAASERRRRKKENRKEKRQDPCAIHSCAWRGRTALWAHLATEDLLSLPAGERCFQLLPDRPAPSLEPLAWMQHGHACLQGSVLRWHRSVQQHQLSRTDAAASVHLQRGYPPHQPVSRRPPAPQSSTQGRITTVVNSSGITWSYVNPTCQWLREPERNLPWTWQDTCFKAQSYERMKLEGNHIFPRSLLQITSITPSRGYFKSTGKQVMISPAWGMKQGCKYLHSKLPAASNLHQTWASVALD